MGRRHGNEHQPVLREHAHNEHEDYRPEREWRHLDMWQCQTFIHASIPRYKDAGGRPQSVEVPWAESRNRITDLLNLFFVVNTDDN